MTSLIRPSLILKMDLDERVFSDEMIAEIKRSYSYVAPSVVASHPAGEGYPEHNLRFMVKLHRPYWDIHDEGAQELWQGVMPKWLHNMFFKVSNTITASNKVRAEAGERGLKYAWLELEFGENALMAIKTASDGAIPEQGVEWVERVRALMCDGAFGDGVTCVRIPSRASYEAQLAAAEAAQARAAEDVAGEEAAEGVDETAAEAAATDAIATADTAADDAAAADESADQDAAAALPEPPAFDVDYTIWGIEYTDGTVRAYDSAAGAFAE